jgi:hypothetical protein
MEPRARTVETFYGELLVLDVLTKCRHMKIGWCGTRKDGEVVNFVYDPSVKPPVLARMPDDKNYVLWTKHGA